MKSLGNDFKNIIGAANLKLMVKLTHLSRVHFNRQLIMIGLQIGLAKAFKRF